MRVPRAFPLEGAAPGGRPPPCGGVARRGACARRGKRRRGRRAHDRRPLDRPRDRRRGPRARSRPDRARIVAALATPVAVLLADRRPRASPRAVRGARRRVPRGNVRVAVGLPREGGDHRLRARRLCGCEAARRRGVGRHLRRRGRERARAARRLEGRLRRRPRDGQGNPRGGRVSRRRRRPSSRPTATTRTS